MLALSAGTCDVAISTGLPVRGFTPVRSSRSFISKAFMVKLDEAVRMVRKNEGWRREHMTPVQRELEKQIESEKRTGQLTPYLAKSGRMEDMERALADCDCQEHLLAEYKGRIN